MLKFGISAFQTCARHSFVDQIDVGVGIPVWNPIFGAALICGSVKTEHDIRDFAYFTASNNFEARVFSPPSHIYLSGADVELCDTATRIDSALLGDVMESKR